MTEPGTRYTVRYSRKGDEIVETTPFATLDEALARTRFLAVNGLADIGSIKVDLTKEINL